MAKNQSPDANPIISKVPIRAWIALAMLVCVYTFSWIDRSLIIILVEPISQDLKVSNTEMGLLTGFVASLLYSLSGFPIARLADKGSRRHIIALAIGTWSALTVACGFASNFIVLAFSRFGISISSAGCSPAAYSMISDYFPQARRGLAIAIYSLGISIGMWAGLTFGGIIADQYGWRNAFIVLGAPGILVALAFFLIVREPQRGAYDSIGDSGERQYSLKEAASHILGHPCFLAIALGYGLTSIGNSSFEYWVPTYMVRVQHLSSTEVGSISGLLQGVTGFFGTLIFGFAADRLGSHNARWYLWLPMIAISIMTPATLLFFHSAGAVMYGCYFVIELFGSAFSAPLFAASQMLLPPRLRALGMATILFTLNVLGVGSGPFLTGWLSDVLHTHGISEGLAPAIMLMKISGVFGIACLGYAAYRLKPIMPKFT